jgi:hypothetical protein
MNSIYLPSNENKLFVRPFVQSIKINFVNSISTIIGRKFIEENLKVIFGRLNFLHNHFLINNLADNKFVGVIVALERIETVLEIYCDRNTGRQFQA